MSVSRRSALKWHPRRHAARHTQSRSCSVCGAWPRSWSSPWFRRRSPSRPRPAHRSKMPDWRWLLQGIEVTFALPSGDQRHHRVVDVNGILRAFVDDPGNFGVERGVLIGVFQIQASIHNQRDFGSNQLRRWQVRQSLYHAQRQNEGRLDRFRRGWQIGPATRSSRAISGSSATADRRQTVVIRPWAIPISTNPNS